MKRIALTEQAVREAVGAEGLMYHRPAWGSAISDELARLRRLAAVDDRGFGIVVPARTDTKWFHSFCAPEEVRFLRGRIRFDGKRGGAPFPSAVIVTGKQSRPRSTWWWDIRAGELLQGGA